MDILLKSITGRVRENDEDSVLGITFSKISKGEIKDRALLTLADGMGGGSAGEVASTFLTSCAGEQLTPLLVQEHVSVREVEAAIQSTIAEANKKIAVYATENGLNTIGTTASIAFVDGDEVVVGNVGDSRAYIVSKSAIRQITHDHSVVQELFDQGIITKDQMRTHPEKNLITKAVGLEESVTVDIIKTKLFRGDYLFLCCDGLWESMPELDIMTILASNEPRKALDLLIDSANTLDGSDNISAVLGIPDQSASSAEEYVQLTTKKLARAPLGGEGV